MNFNQQAKNSCHLCFHAPRGRGNAPIHSEQFFSVLLISSQVILTKNVIAIWDIKSFHKFALKFGRNWKIPQQLPLPTNIKTLLWLRRNDVIFYLMVRGGMELVSPALKFAMQMQFLFDCQSNICLCSASMWHRSYMQISKLITGLLLTSFVVLSTIEGHELETFDEIKVFFSCRQYFEEKKDYIIVLREFPSCLLCLSTSVCCQNEADHQMMIIRSHWKRSWEYSKKVKAEEFFFMRVWWHYIVHCKTRLVKRRSCTGVDREEGSKFDHWVLPPLFPVWVRSDVRSVHPLCI